MARWEYYGWMGRSNPVCVDVGKIEKIIPTEAFGAQDMTPPVKAIIADGKRYWCSGKPWVLLLGGVVCFKQNRESDVKCEWRSFPEGIRDEDEVEMNSRIVYLDSERSMCHPITNDPRVLYIMCRGWEAAFDPEETAWRDFKPTMRSWKELVADIPTMEQAIAYLKQVDLWYECVPLGSAMLMFQKWNLTQADLLRRLCERAKGWDPTPYKTKTKTKGKG